MVILREILDNADEMKSLLQKGLDPLLTVPTTKKVIYSPVLRCFNHKNQLFKEIF